MYLLYIQLFNMKEGAEKTFMSYSRSDEEKLFVFLVS